MLRHLKVSLAQQDPGKPRHGSKMPRFEQQRLLDIPDRVVIFAHEVIDGGSLVPAFSKLRRLLDYLIEGVKSQPQIMSAHRGDTTYQQVRDNRIIDLPPSLPDLLGDTGTLYKIVSS